jgi:hypothetical protein
MKNKTTLILFPLALSLAACGGTSGSVVSSLVSSASSSELPSSGDSSVSSATSAIPLPTKAIFYQKLAAAVSSPKGYAFERDSYDQAFDANMVPIIGKYTVTAWQSVATLYASSHYRNLATSFIHSTPVDLLAEPKSGDEEGATTHDYSLQDDGKQLTYIDDIVEESKESINYAVYDEDIIHSYASLVTAFPSIPNKAPRRLKRRQELLRCLDRKR